MKKSEYRAYIQGAAWQQRRKRYLAEMPYCEKCWLPRWLASIAYDQDLHVHHLNYQHVGTELDEDLQALCPRCHEIETFGRSALREIQPVTCPTCKRDHYNRYSDECDECSAGMQSYIESVMDAPFGDGPRGGDPNYKVWMWFIEYCIVDKGIDAVRRVVDEFEATYGRRN